MQKQSVFMALLILTACQPSPVVNPLPKPTASAMPTPTQSPIPIPTASQSNQPNPLPEMSSTPLPMPTAGTTPVPAVSPSPESSVFPSPPPLAPRPDSRRLLDPKDNITLATFSDTALNSPQSALLGLMINENNDGLIYWTETATRTFKARPIRDFSFGETQRIGNAEPEGRMSFRFGIDGSGNGLLVWNQYPGNDTGTFPSPPSLSYARVTNFQIWDWATRENIGQYILHDLAYLNPDSGSLLVSQPRRRSSQDAALGTGSTPIERIPLVRGEPVLANRSLVMSLPEYFAGEEIVKVAHLNSLGNGLVIHADIQSRSRMAWTRIENFQASSVSNDLPEININNRPQDNTLSLTNGNGYLRWTEGNLMPVVNFEPRPERKIRLSHSDEELMGRARGDISLDANGTGLLAWSESLKETGQARVYVKKIQNFVEVGLPYTMTWPDSSTLVQNIKISVNSQGKGYLSGMNLICTSGNPCDARLGRQIWVRRIEDFVP